MQRTLGDDKLPGRIKSGNKVGVNVVAALVVVAGLELDPGVVVGQNIGEPVFRPVARKIGRAARFFSSDVFQFFVLLGKAEVGVGGHDPVVFGEVFELDGLGGLDDAVRQRDVVAVTHVASPIRGR